MPIAEHVTVYEPCSQQVSDEDCGRPAVYFADIQTSDDDPATFRVYRCREHQKRPFPASWVVVRDGVVVTEHQRRKVS